MVADHSNFNIKNFTYSILFNNPTSALKIHFNLLSMHIFVEKQQELPQLCYLNYGYVELSKE